MTVYFTDRNLGKRFPEILAASGLTVHRHADHFVHDTDDETWLQAIGENDWVAITHDARIRYKPNELAAVRDHDVRLLVVVGNAPFPLLAKHFVDTVPKIEAFLGAKQPPLIAKIYRPTPADLAKNPNAPGRIEQWYPPKE